MLQLVLTWSMGLLLTYIYRPLLTCSLIFGQDLLTDEQLAEGAAAATETEQKHMVS